MARTLLALFQLVSVLGMSLSQLSGKYVEEMVERSNYIRNGNITTITSVSRQCHCIKTDPFPFTRRQLACTSTDNSLIEEMVENQTTPN